MKKNNLMTMDLQFFAGEVEGENEMEVATPSEVEVGTENVESTENDAESVVETNEQENVQSDEENARYAAARRRAEQEFAERQKEQDLEFERRFKGFENPITHQPIRSQKDYLEALDAQEKLQFEQSLSSGNVDTDALNNYIDRQISNNPVVLQAQAVIEANQKAQFEAALNESVKEISKIDPSIKTADDIFSAPNWNDVFDYVQKGMDLTAAYKVVNFDRLMANTTAGAKQATINNMKSTQHLNQTNGVASGNDSGVDIPESELKAWQRAFPEASMKELRAKYNRTL